MKIDMVSTLPNSLFAVRSVHPNAYGTSLIRQPDVKLSQENS